MRLLSVNVGQPREVRWSGRTVRTSIWKSEVPDRRWVSRLNVAGDAQADLVGHGGEHRAVYVYDISAYRHWASSVATTSSMASSARTLTVVLQPAGLPRRARALSSRGVTSRRRRREVGA